MRGDVEHALAMLRSIGPDQQYYLEARDKMANIYLNHLKDKRMFATCYRYSIYQILELEVQGLYKSYFFYVCVCEFSHKLFVKRRFWMHLKFNLVLDQVWSHKVEFIQYF